MYSFKNALDKRIAYLAHMLRGLDTKPTCYVPSSVLSLQYLGLIPSPRQEPVGGLLPAGPEGAEPPPSLSLAVAVSFAWYSITLMVWRCSVHACDAKRYVSTFTDACLADSVLRHSPTFSCLLP